MRIQKRDGRVVPYEESKIIDAIRKANNEVEEGDRADEALISEILETVKNEGRKMQAFKRLNAAREEISQYLPDDFDPERELEEARMEKYGSID